MAIGREIITELYAAVDGYVKMAFDTLSARVGLLDEKLRNIPAGPKGESGRDVDMAAVALMINEAVAKAVSAIPPAKDGKGVDQEEAWKALREMVSEAVAALPRAKDGEPGKDADEVAILGGLERRLEKLVEALPKPKDGRDGVDGKGVDEQAVLIRLQGYLDQSVKLIPIPKDGKDGISGKDGRSIDSSEVTSAIQAAVALAVAALPEPKSGRDGKDVDYTALRGIVLEAVALAVKDLPRAQDGKDAAHLDPHSGIDVNRSYPRGDYALHAGGLWRAAKSTSAMDGWECVLNGIASVTIETENEREFCVKAKQTNGTETVTRFKMATPLDRGVWKPDAKYEKGDGVTYGGSWFIAQVDAPSDRPEVSEQWRLATKRGRDGKDGVMREPPKPLKIKVGP